MHFKILHLFLTIASILMPFTLHAIPDYQIYRPPTEKAFVDTLLYFGYDSFQFSETMFLKDKVERSKILFETHPEYASLMRNKGVTPSYRALERPPTLNLFDNNELKGTPYVTIDALGIKVEGNIICSWHEGTYNPFTELGKGTLLRFCPKDFPVLSYNGSFEHGLTWIRFGLQIDTFDNGKISTMFKGKKLFAKLPNSVTWIYNLPAAKLDAPIINAWYEVPKFKKFLNSILACAKSEDFQCLLPFIATPSNNLYPRRTYKKVNGKIVADGALSIFNQTSKVSYIQCPMGKAMFLSKEEFAKCIFWNKNLSKELQECLSKPPRYGDVEIIYRKGPQTLKEFKAELKAPNVFQGIVMHGNYFDCAVYLYDGEYFLGDFEPNYRKIEQMVQDKKLQIVGPSEWPFKKPGSVPSDASQSPPPKK